MKQSDVTVVKVTEVMETVVRVTVRRRKSMQTVHAEIHISEDHFGGIKRRKEGTNEGRKDEKHVARYS